MTTEERKELLLLIEIAENIEKNVNEGKESINPNSDGYYPYMMGVYSQTVHALKEQIEYFYQKTLNN